MSLSQPLCKKYGLLNSSKKFQTIIKGSQIFDRAHTKIKFPTISISKQDNQLKSKFLPYSKHKRSFDLLYCNRKRKSIARHEVIARINQSPSKQFIVPQIINKNVYKSHKLVQLQQKIFLNRNKLNQKACQTLPTQPSILFQQKQLKHLIRRKAKNTNRKRTAQMNCIITNHGWKSNILDQTTIGFISKSDFTKFN